MEENLRYTWQ